MPHFVGDKLSNVLANFQTGGPTDKVSATTHVLALLHDTELEAAYRGNWLARKIVDIVPEDMTREWRVWRADAEQLTLIENTEARVKLRSKVCEALQMARLYGGSAIYFAIKGQRADTPFDPEKVGKDGLAFIHVLLPGDLQEGALDTDPLSETFGEPAYYTTSRTTNGATVANPDQQIHPSRIVRFIGKKIPNRTRAATNNRWGDPLLQIVNDALIQAGLGLQIVSALMLEAKVDVLGVPNLAELLSTPEGTQQVTARLQGAMMLKSLTNALVTEAGNEGDAGETWEQKQINFSGFPPLLQLYLQVVSGAADVPATRLLGQSPAGLNATGESDIRNYYDHLSSAQRQDLSPQLERLDEAVLRSALGSRPPEVWYDWAPLWQLTDTERATIAKQEADTDNVLATSGLVPTPVLENMVKARLIDRGYPGAEQAYADFEDGTLEPIVDPADLPDPAPPDPNANPGQNPNDPAGGGPGGASPFGDQLRFLADRFNPNQPRDPNGRFAGVGGLGINPAEVDAQRIEWTRNSGINTVDRARELGQINQTALRSVVAQIEPTMDVRFANPGIKSAERIAEKMARKGIGPGELTDVVRGGFTVTSPRDADAILAKLREQFEVADEGWYVTPAGYFDRKALVRFKNGQVGEIQFWQKDMLHAKEKGGGHDLYVKWQNTTDEGERKRLEQQMRDTYAAAVKKMPRSWKRIARSGAS